MCYKLGVKIKSAGNPGKMQIKTNKQKQIICSHPFLLEVCSQEGSARKSTRACKYFHLRLLQMIEGLEVKGREQRSSQTAIPAGSSYIMAHQRNGFCKCEQEQPVENCSSLQGLHFCMLADVLCQHLLCSGSPLWHFNLSVPTFGFAHLVSLIWWLRAFWPS